LLTRLKYSQHIIRLPPVDKLGLGHAYNAAIIDLVLPSFSRRSYYQTCSRLTMSGFKLQKHIPHSQELNHTFRIRRQLNSYPLRTAFGRSTLRTGHGIYLFPASSHQIYHSGRACICQHSRTSVSILPRTLRLSIKAITTLVLMYSLRFFLLGYPFITASVIWRLFLFCSGLTLS
jgi:hypothetical protein